MYSLNFDVKSFLLFYGKEQFSAVCRLYRLNTEMLAEMEKHILVLKLDDGRFVTVIPMVRPHHIELIGEPMFPAAWRKYSCAMYYVDATETVVRKYDSNGEDISPLLQSLCDQRELTFYTGKLNNPSNAAVVAVADSDLKHVDRYQWLAASVMGIALDDVREADRERAKVAYLILLGNDIRKIEDLP